MWKEWYQQTVHPIRETAGFFTGVLPNPFRPITGGGKSIICYIKTITDVYGPKADLGTLIINIDYRHIEDLFARVPKDQVSYIMRNSNGGLIYANRPEAEAAPELAAKAIKEINGVSIYSVDESLVFQDNSLEDGWVLEKIVPRAYLNGLIRHGLQSIIVIGILSVAIAAATIVALMLSLTRSVAQLQNAMKRVSRGDLNTVVHLKSHDEMEELAGIFNTMVRDVRELLGQVAQQEQQKKESALKTLLMQINPHFLSNALYSIVSLARKEKCDSIIVVVNSLARMLQKIMNFEQHYVTISEEITYLDNYLEMQRIRYGELFEISYDIDEAARGCQIPKLLLQPIVENAMYHGILPAERPGTIRITVKREDSRLCFAIKDNGIGIDEKQLNEVFSDEPAASKNSFMKIGLRNVDERVRLCNGDKVGLTVQSRPGEGTTISFLLPAVSA
jgi:two-component system sensor histidine kinase YesM